MSRSSAPRLLEGELTREIIAVFFTVYNELGSGYLESVYRRALSVELSTRGFSTECEVPFAVHYRGVCVGEYRADLVVQGRVLVESKVVDRLAPAHEAQLLNYLKASGLEVGLLLNFGPHATFRRLVSSRSK